MNAQYYECMQVDVNTITNIWKFQVLGKVPTISIDKTDGCQMYLSPESLDVEIVSSKSSEMNVLVPKGNCDYVSVKNIKETIIVTNMLYFPD